MMVFNKLIWACFCFFFFMCCTFIFLFFILSFWEQPHRCCSQHIGGTTARLLSLSPQTVTVTMMRTGAKVFLHIIIDCTKKNKVCIYCVQMLINKKIWKSCFLSVILLFFFLFLCVYAPVWHIWVCKQLIIWLIDCVCVRVCVTWTIHSLEGWVWSW